MLDLGCGSRKVPGTLGVDVRRAPDVDLLADVARLPFADGSIDGIVTRHTLEHVDDMLTVVEECWRVLRPGGLLKVVMPNASCTFTSWLDPTHRRALFIESFQYFEPRNPLRYYSRARFETVYARLHLTSSHQWDQRWRWPRRVLTAVAEAVANRSRWSQYLAERFWGHWIGGFEEMTVVLRAIKEPQASPSHAMEAP